MNDQLQRTMNQQTFTFHSTHETFLVPTVLASVPLSLVNDAIPLFTTRICQILTNCPLEKPLASFTTEWHKIIVYLAMDTKYQIGKIIVSLRIRNRKIVRKAKDESKRENGRTKKQKNAKNRKTKKQKKKTKNAKNREKREKTWPTCKHRSVSQRLDHHRCCRGVWIH